MNDDNHRPEPDVLDQAVRELRDAPIPTGPPVERIAATLAAIQNRLAGTVPSEPTRQLQRRRRLMRYIRYGAFSTAAAALVGVLILLSGPGPVVAIEKVRDEVKKVDSVIYFDTQVDPQGYASEVKYFNRGKQARMELSRGKTVYVFDHAKRKALSYSTYFRVYELYDIPVESDDTQAMQFVQEVKRLLEGAAKKKGTEMVDGVKATVFEIVGGTMYTFKGDYKVWVDPKTALPVRISYTHKQTDPTDLTPVKRTFDRFNWKPSLEDELYSLVPPKGYTEGIPGFVKPKLPAKKK